MQIRFTKQEEEHLRKLGVMVVSLFGSRAMGAEHARSDYDFGVLMRHAGSRRGDAMYDQLYDILSPHCPRTLENDVLDIVFLNEAPLELRMHIVRYGQILFDDAPLERLRFETRTTLEYADYRPILDEFDRTILASV